MITPELVSYIKKQIEDNISKDLIVSRLVGAGWKMSDVHEGFLNIDSYHEPEGGDSIFEVKKEEPKIEIQKIEVKKEEPKNEILEVKKIELPKIETEKVWTPISVPIREVRMSNIQKTELKKPVYAESYDKAKEETKIEVQNVELPVKKEEPILSPVSRVSINPVNYITQIKKEDTPLVNKNNFDIPQKSKENPVKDLSKMAMISSYQTDLSALTQKKEIVVKKKSKKSFGWIIIIIIMILILGGLFLAFKKGYINIKSFNIASVINKDPKVLLLKNSEVLASLKSYKTETNIEISSPTYANLLSGLIVDKYLSSLDKDSFLINTLGVIDKSGGIPLSDNFITVKSSLFSDYINIDVKSNGSDLFVSIPDISKATDRFVPDPAVVKINKEQFSLIPGLFTKKEDERLNRINLYEIMLSGISSYINNENLNSYNEIINNVNPVEKGIENVKGIDTYHYSIGVDTKLSKNFIKKVAANFVSNLSAEDSDKLNQMIMETTVSSFDVWIGKADNNIYQYSIVFDIPLSNILEPGDKDIGDSKVSISWKTTYYDFNIQNNLFMPSQFVDATDFINSSKKVQLKNGVTDLKELADNLFIKEKSYGVKSNSSGNCVEPILGSLFSPTGHSLDTTKEVEDMGTLIKEILGKTNGNGFCYSTTKDWSFTVPIADNYSTESLPEGGYKTFFCTDSTGAKEELTAFPKGSVCLPKVDSPITTVKQ